MKYRYFIFYLYILLVLPSQVDAQIYGTVRDSLSLQPLDHVNINIENTTIGTQSDSLGNFILFFQDFRLSANLILLVMQEKSFRKYLKEI